MYNSVIPDELKFGGIMYGGRYTDSNSHVIFQCLSLLFLNEGGVQLPCKTASPAEKYVS